MQEGDRVGTAYISLTWCLETIEFLIGSPQIRRNLYHLDTSFKRVLLIIVVCVCVCVHACARVGTHTCQDANVEGRRQFAGVDSPFSHICPRDRSQAADLAAGSTFAS